MIDDAAEAARQAQESAALRALCAAARDRQRQAGDKNALTSRLPLASARSMSQHLALPQERLADLAASMAFWQLYLPSAAGVWDFERVREKLPWSCERVRAALAPVEHRPQLVAAVFHMALFPVVSTLIGAVWRDLHPGPLHLLVARRNLGWLRVGENRWVEGAVRVVSTDPSGLRALLGGLKDGSIRRLLILADGPHAPGAPGTRPLRSISPALGIRTALLAKIHEIGIPLIPFSHEWEDDRLLIAPCPILEPGMLSEAGTIDAIVERLEGLLQRRPEQWLNWSAASIRT